MAEILSFSGRGEHRATAEAAWQAARIKQSLEDGHYVRTLAASSMALMFAPQTQIKLGSDSLFHIRAPSQNNPATLDLKKGRSWSQVKTERGTATLAGADAAAGVPALRVQTPGGVAAIRGTEWAVEVAADGLTTVTVLEGRVEFGNAQGSVNIGAAEEASARPGEAPVKRQLINPQQRVQWVAVYRFPWERYPELATDDWRDVRSALDSGDYAAAHFAVRTRERSPLAALLLAEFALAGGDPAAVESLLATQTTAASADPDAADPRIAALRAEAALRRDETAQAAALLRQAPRQNETALVAGELARLDGQAGAATAAYADARRFAPQDARGWLGGGRVAAEREDLAVAWPLFERAAQLAPWNNAIGAEILAERAHADTLGNRLAEARAGYAAALAQAPDDYVALTGLGLLELKSGQPQAALEPLLKATAIEPRYARAVLYAGIAYYQLRRELDALDTLARATRLDPNDPLPHFHAAMIHTDRHEPGEAVAAARRAIALWPKLKSLNQVASDQKGSANLGTTLERFGLEEWALAAAWQAYTPFWGGSHLFLADRTPDTYGKNSELFQGFLADPLVFGADPRRNTLIARPDSVVGGRLKFAQGPQRVDEAGAQWTGQAVSPFPVAWFIDAEANRARPDDEPLKSELANLTIGLGARPRFDTGLFLFANRYKLDFNFTDAGNTYKDAPARIEPTRVDLGLHHKFSPEANFWMKLGYGSQDRSVIGPLDTPASLMPLLGGRPRVDFAFGDGNEERDLQFKQAWVSGRHSLHAVLEQADGDSRYLTSFDSRNSFGGLLNFGSAERQQRKSTRLSLNDFLTVSPALQLHLQLAYTDYRQKDRQTTITNIVPQPQVPAPQNSRFDIGRLSPRLGAVWNFAVAPAPTFERATLRAAWREWLQPAGAATLDRLDTAGLPLDTRSAKPGGLLQNGRLQLEWETPRRFYLAYLESQRLDNRSEGFVPDISAMLTELEKLRQKAPGNVSGEDLLEGTPQYGKGRVDSLGLAGNWIVTDRASLYARLILRDSESRRDNPGNQLPYLPKSTFVLGGTQYLSHLWTVGAQAVHRSTSFTTVDHATRLPAGWGMDASATWRSPDKQWRFSLVAKNLARERPAPRSALAQLEAWW